MAHLGRVLRCVGSCDEFAAARLAGGGRCGLVTPLGCCPGRRVVRPVVEAGDVRKWWLGAPSPIPGRVAIMSQQKTSSLQPETGEDVLQR